MVTLLRHATLYDLDDCDGFACGDGLCNEGYRGKGCGGRCGGFGGVGVEEPEALGCFVLYGVRSDDGDPGDVPGGSWEGGH